MLEVRDLDVSYGDARALEGIHLEVREGEIVCVVGPNGAGKSTLIHALAGVHRPVRGRILMEGTDIARLPPHRVCQQGLAIVPEGRRVFPDMTVQENLELGAYRAGARPRRAETLAWVHDLFPRLRERAGQAAGSLSGGEQQMLAIGRALMARPRLLLMDEPSLGLAPIIVDEVFEVVRTINGSGVSVLLVEQNVERAFRCAGRGYLLSEGRVVLGGSSSELLASGAVRSAVLGV